MTRPSSEQQYLIHIICRGYCISTLYLQYMYHKQYLTGSAKLHQAGFSLRDFDNVDSHLTSQQQDARDVLRLPWRSIVPLSSVWSIWSSAARTSLTAASNAAVTLVSSLALVSKYGQQPFSSHQARASSSPTSLCSMSTLLPSTTKGNRSGSLTSE